MGQGCSVCRPDVLRTVVYNCVYYNPNSHQKLFDAPIVDRRTYIGEVMNVPVYVPAVNGKNDDIPEACTKNKRCPKATTKKVLFTPPDPRPSPKSSLTFFKKKPNLTDASNLKLCPSPKIYPLSSENSKRSIPQRSPLRYRHPRSASSKPGLTNAPDFGIKACWSYTSGISEKRRVDAATDKRIRGLDKCGTTNRGRKQRSEKKDETNQLMKAGVWPPR